MTKFLKLSLLTHSSFFVRCFKSNETVDSIITFPLLKSIRMGNVTLSLTGPLIFRTRGGGLCKFLNLLTLILQLASTLKFYYFYEKIKVKFR